MGSAISNNNNNNASSTGHRKNRLFTPSCFRFNDCDGDGDGDSQVADCQSKDSSCHDSNGNHIISHNDHVKDSSCGEVKVDKSDDIARKASSTEINKWGQLNLSEAASRVGSSSRAWSPSNTFLSRCSFFGGNSSFRMSRAPCIGLSSANPTPSANADDPNIVKDHTRDSVSRTKSSRGRDFLPSCVINRCLSPRRDDHALGCLDSNSTASGISPNSRDDHIVSTVNVLRDGNNLSAEYNVNLQPPANFTEMENLESRHTGRRIGAERNVRFSRTLSVGRLRDRVLRRSSFPELTFSPLQQDREVRNTGEGVGDGQLAPHGSALVSPIYHSTFTDSSSYNGQNYEVETSRARESRYRDLLEHRSNFLERRGRIRSQVRALQRMGNRFENLSGHERSCIIAGQHQTGHCTCHITSRNSGSNDDTGARQSISRIVMLAEALFEVLDEIHQQSVVLSSRPSVSSLGSVPAPSDAVESLPVKLYSKPQQHLIEEDAQCYICLVEYEEGDTVRTLPCHHEFHRACVDKWLKEIHRVCPLCRGDICTPGAIPLEN